MRAYPRSLFVLTAATGLTLLAMTLPAAGAENRRVISLDGTWNTTDGPMGQSPEKFEHNVPVPGLVDMAKPAFQEVGVPSKQREAFWYRRTFRVDGDIPAVATLKVHKAAFGTRVWLNGQAVGEHIPCFTPGYFDVHEPLKGGGSSNELLVRVGATREALPASIPTGHDFEKVRYIPGIYDSVELILSGAPSIVRVQAAPDLPARAVRVATTVRAANAPADAKLALAVREAKSGKVVGTVTTEAIHLEAADEKTIDARIAIEDCHLWSPEDPFLYELEASTGADAMRTRFGMRSFGFDKATGRAVLNGQPYFLRGTNVCIFRFFEEPLRGDKPWREEWVRKLHRAFRSMHWNSIRYCIGFPPEMWYRIADEEGLLIQDEFPIWHGAKWPEELNAGELIKEYTEWMQEHWNHPCVAIWDAQNETVTTETGKAIAAVRKLDLSSRPWDNGYAVPDAPTDSYESHPYVFNNPSFRLSGMPRLSSKHWGSVRPNTGGNPMILNEYGWLWLNRDGTPTTLTTKVYENLVGPDTTPAQRQTLYARYLAALTEYWRCSRRFAGVLHFCGLTYSRPGGQTCDNFADLETLAFEPNFGRYVRDAFAPVGVMLDEWADELPAGEKHEFRVVAINDLPETQKATVTLRLMAGDKPVFEASQPGEIPALGKISLAFGPALSIASGKYQAIAELRRAGTEPVRSYRDFEVLTPEQRQARRGIPVVKVTASSVVTVNGESFPAENVIDGDLNTRWSSEFADPQWIALDLGAPKSMSRVELIWEAAYGKAYAIQVSTDGQTWKDVYSTKSSRGNRDEVRFPAATARYIRLNGTKRATQFGYSLWEFRVFP